MITGIARSTFMRVRDLQEDDKGNKICSTGILIPKKDKKTVSAIEAAIVSAAVKKLGSSGENILNSRKLHNPLVDGDDLADDPESSVGDEARGHYFIRAKNYKLPGVVDKHGARIEDPDELDEICVSGFWFKFSITFKGFDNEMRGVRAMLNNLMFIKEDTRLDGGKTAEEDFADYAVEEDDEDSDW